MRILAVLLSCPLFTGCMAFGYPSVTQTPTIESQEPEVQAFSVFSHQKTYGTWLIGPFESYKEIEMLPWTNNSIASQSNVYFPYSYVTVSIRPRSLAFPIAQGSNFQSLKIVLYRRGYETVCIPAEWWFQTISNSTKPIWKKAEKLKDLQEAIEKITFSPHDLRSTLEVRQFIAQEYVWLANSEWAAGPDKEKDRKQLLDMAREFEMASDYEED
jgi:hypothetical protein